MRSDQVLLNRNTVYLFYRIGELWASVPFAGLLAGSWLRGPASRSFVSLIILLFFVRCTRIRCTQVRIRTRIRIRTIAIKAGLVRKRDLLRKRVYVRKQTNKAEFAKGHPSGDVGFRGKVG